MALRAQLRTLARRLRDLRETVGELRLAVSEDRPYEPDVALVDRVEDRVTDLQGAVEEALAALAPVLAARGRPSEPMGVDQAGEALVSCQAALEGARVTYWRDLVSYDALSLLLAFGREQGGEWQAWSASVKESIDRCQAPLAAVAAALEQSWREVAERAGLAGVQVRTTTIGQHITVPRQRSPEEARP